jgi:hypothetical protein
MIVLPFTMTRTPSSDVVRNTQLPFGMNVEVAIVPKWLLPGALSRNSLGSDAWSRGPPPP